MDNNTTVTDWDGSSSMNFYQINEPTVSMTRLADNKGWLVNLCPSDDTDHEWGFGTTLANALSDLASSMNEAWDRLKSLNDAELAPPLQKYKLFLVSHGFTADVAPKKKQK